MKHERVVIVGAGPSGIATAIQLKRYKIDPVVLEKEAIGGLLRNAYLIENYPGFPEGINGGELVELFKRQLMNSGVKVRFEEVKRIDYRDHLFWIETNEGIMSSIVLVVGTGTKAKMDVDFEISAGFEDRILCEIVSIVNIKNKKIAIIGAGDAAFDYAQTLSKQNEVTIFNRSDNVQCLPVLWERCEHTRNIKYVDQIGVNSIDKMNSGLQLEFMREHRVFRTKYDYLILAIGREPNLDFLQRGVKENIDNLQKIHILYLIGDVRNGIFRQTAICAGDGIRAAMRIKHFLKVVCR